jgi:acetyl-CoA carboxylase carboxyltransferase component
MSATATQLPDIVRPERLTPIERLEALCDPGSVRVLRSRVSSPRLGERATAGDGVVGATGLVGGRPIACYAQDGRFFGGALGELHAETIVRVLQTAERARIPVVGFVESGGARIQEGTAALAGYGRIFRETVRLTGIVPQISIVSGASAGGGAYSPALTDLIVMTEDAAMFLTGPGVVRDALGEEIDATALGGPRVHDRNGVCHLVESDEASAAARVREILGYLPSVAGGPLPRAGARAGTGENPRDFVPAEPRRAYDVRLALRAIVDRESILELQPRWARNVVTALARIDGRPVAIVANQPRYLGGVLDAESSEKAARFIGFCDSFGIPLVAVVDTPGFMPGSKQEAAGVIRYGASLVRAFAAARVPKFTVVLRKSYGGAYITMNSRDLGADLVMAWPDAELGIMSAKAAVGIVNRRQLRVAPDPEGERERLAEVYAEEHLRADSAAAAGFVDELIEPHETRDRLIRALETFSGELDGAGWSLGDALLGPSAPPRR